MSLLSSSILNVSSPGSLRCSALNPKFAKLKTMGSGTPLFFRYRSLLDLANFAPLR